MRYRQGWGCVMIAAIAAPASAQPPAPTAASPTALTSEQDILVIARKLRKIRVDYVPMGRHLKRCDIALSSGDDRLDRIACAIVKACVADGNTEPNMARACFYRRIDSLDVPADAVAFRNDDATPPPADLHAVIAMPPRERGKDEIIVEGKRPEVETGRWQLTLTTMIFKPSTFLRRGGVAMFPPSHWKLCLPNDSAENNMMRLLGASPDKKSLLSGCSAMKLAMEGEKIKGSYSCARSDGSYDARVNGRFQPASLDVSVTTLMEEAASPEISVRPPTLVDTSEKTYEFRSRLVAKRIGDCRG